MGSCFNMTSQIIIVLVLLSMFGMTSLIHLELDDVFSISRHQMARAQEVHSLDYLIYKFEIPKITSIGLNQEDSNVTSIGSNSSVENQTILVAKLIANFVENSLKQATTTLQITSLDPRMETPKHTSNISESYKGIPIDLETDKRDIAKRILSLNKDFGSVYFLLPNGDVYLGEPYLGQTQLPRLNFADRDWYKGIFAMTNNISRGTNTASSSHENSDTNTSGAIIPTPPHYISEVFQSAAIHAPATGVAVPIYDKNASGILELHGDESKFNSSSPENPLDTMTTTDTLSGYWVGVLNMNETRNYIDQLGLSSHNLRAVVVDHNGTAIIDTLHHKATPREVDALKGNSSSQTMLIDLQSVERGLNGETGSIVENVNGTMALISYHPIEAIPHTWAAILMDLDSDRT